MKYLDANIFLRYLVKPQNSLDRQKQQACAALVQRVKAGQERVTTCEAVITEVIYNLVSPRQYALGHDEAAARLRPLLALRGLQFPRKRVYFRALDLFARAQFLDIEDAVIVAHLERDGEHELYSYDRDIDRLVEVTRREP